MLLTIVAWVSALAATAPMLSLTLLLTVLFVLLLAHVADTQTPSARPSLRPSSRRPAKPTQKPTRRPSLHIYGNNYPSTLLTPDTQQAIVGALIIFVFLGMAFEIAQPEILFFVALVFIMLAEILLIGDVLSGAHAIRILNTMLTLLHRLRERIHDHDRRTIHRHRRRGEVAHR